MYSNNFVSENKITIASYLIMAVFILAAFLLKLVPTLIAGLLIYLMIHAIFNGLEKRMKADPGRLTIFIFAGITVILLTLISVLIYNSFLYGSENIADLTNETLRIIGELKNYLPQSIVSLIPIDMLMVKEKALGVVQSNVSNIFAVTASSLKTMTQMFLGMIIGAVIAFTSVGGKDTNLKPLSKALLMRIKIFVNQFSKLIIAQVKISIINTILTAIYLIAVLPIFGINMPYKTTLLIVTFICGLIPVLGGLISNSLIIILSLTISFKVVVSSVIFLCLVNLSEYYTNAKIVGGEMQTSMWELLCAMIVMEVVFGLWGIALAPVIYGYIKEELKMKNLV